jgi:hypothetical protein
MEKNFTVTVELDPRELTQKPDDIILKAIRAKYQNVCYGNHFLIEVTKLVARGKIFFSANSFPSKPLCDIIFSARYIIYKVDQQVALKIREISYSEVHCENDHIIARLPVSALEEYFKPEPGLYFVALVDELNYQNFSKITMNVSPYVPYPGNFITRIVPGTVDTIMREATQKCLQYVREKVPGCKKFLEIFNKTNRARIEYKKYSIFDNVPEITENQRFITRAYDPLQEGIYYLAPDSAETLEGQDQSVISEAISLETILYRYSVDIYNFIYMMEFLGRMTDEEFVGNEVVWKVYRK